FPHHAIKSSRTTSFASSSDNIIIITDNEKREWRLDTGVAMEIFAISVPVLKIHPENEEMKDWMKLNFEFEKMKGCWVAFDAKDCSLQLCSSLNLSVITIEWLEAVMTHMLKLSGELVSILDRYKKQQLSKPDLSKNARHRMLQHV
ncbi:MAG: type III secretion system chaperone, partial [Pseudomonadota bacterium]